MAWDLTFKRPVQLPMGYKTIRLDCACKGDLAVEDLIGVEKAVDRLLPGDSAQFIAWEAPVQVAFFARASEEPR